MRVPLQRAQDALPTDPVLTTVALADELEKNDAIRRRITVAY